MAQASYIVYVHVFMKNAWGRVIVTATASLHVTRVIHLPIAWTLVNSYLDLHPNFDVLKLFDDVMSKPLRLSIMQIGVMRL